MGLRNRPAWQLYALFGAIAGVILLLTPNGAARDCIVTDPVATSAVLIALFAALARRQLGRCAWLLIAAGLLSFAVGDYLFSYKELVGHADPFPSVADIGYLAGYPLLWAGLVLLSRARATRRNWTAGIDAAAITTSIALASWLFFLNSVAHDQTLSTSGKFISLAYPIGDVLLLATVILMAMSAGRRPAALWFLGGGIVSMLVSDSAYLGALDTGTFASGAITDLTWIGFYVLIGVAVLHPSADTLSIPVAERPPRLTPLRLTLLAAASGAAPLMFTIQQLRGVRLEIPLMIGTSTFLFLLVIARMALLLRSQEAHGVELEQQQDLLTNELERYSRRDLVTGLANRATFVARLDHALSAVDDNPPAVLLLEVEGLRLVNESIGRSAGDELLRAIAERLERMGRRGDTFAWTGDAFAVLVEDVSIEPPVSVARRLVKALRLSFKLSVEHETTVGVSAGVALGEEGESGEMLLRNAEIALSKARETGNGSVELFEPGMHKVIFERIVLKGQLEQAIDESRLSLEYQPIVDMTTGSWWGAETLVRWRHPDRGMVPPDDFIPLAEETGLIVPIGEWVLEEALNQAAEWERAPIPFVVTVNLSARQLGWPVLVDRVAEIVRETGVDPGAIVLEITETALADVDSALKTLTALKKLGVQIAIDDFGTGYSSLQYLRRFPADIIKIPKPFVDGVRTPDSESDRVAHAIVHLGEAFGLRTLAEGIEDRAQFERMRQLGCELGQGFLFSEPLSADEVTRLILADQQWLAA